MSLKVAEFDRFPDHRLEKLGNEEASIGVKRITRRGKEEMNEYWGNVVGLHLHLVPQWHPYSIKELFKTVSVPCSTQFLILTSKHFF